MQTSLVASALLLAIHVSSAPAPVTPRSQYPFSQIVAFGDNLSDNGNGSVAHGVAAPGDPTNSIYGFNTWTNGPVMVSYLSGLLGVPLLDYAYGHADGGSKFGATIDNSYTQSTANAPSSKDQIANYSSSAHVASAADSLHFLWIGANDINLYHISTSLGADNSAFATSMSTMLAEQVKSLLSLGAKTIVVPSLYPKHISPSKAFYAADDAGYQTLGEAINGANLAIESSLQQFGSSVIYYDVFKFMMGIWNNHATYNITHVGDEFCDGYSQQDWDLCVTDKEGNQFYWMQYLDITTTIHQMIAQDLFNVIQQHYGGSGPPASTSPTTTSTPVSQATPSTSISFVPSSTSSTSTQTSSPTTPSLSVSTSAPPDSTDTDECESDL